MTAKKTGSGIWAPYFYFIYILIVIELMIRGLVFFMPLQREPAVPPSLGQFDPQFGWSLKPSFTAYSSATGKKIEYHTNSAGFRGRETPYEKSKGTFRIVILGDSRTYGFGNAIEEHYSYFLERQFKNVEVINLGVCGYGVDQELLALKLKGLKYQPDLVFAYVGHYGDQRHLRTKVFGRSKPRFILKDGGLELVNFPVKPEPVSLSKKIDTWFFYHLKTYSFVKTLLLSPKKKDEDSAAETQKALLDDKSSELFVLGARIVEEMAAVAKRNSARFVLATQIDDLERRSREKGISVLNVSDLLNGSKYHLPNGLHHINKEGNALFAQRIAGFLKSESFIPETHWNNK